MRYRAPVLTATMFAAALSLSACGGGDTKAAATSSTTSTSSSTSPSTTMAPAAPSAPAVSSASTTAAPTVTKTVQASPSPTSTVTKTATPSGGQTIAPPSESLADAISNDPSAGGAFPSKDCGNRIQANSNASCPFAQAVVNAWRGHTSMDGVIYVKSPTTGDTYGVRCSAGALGSDCETSQNAWVWAPV